VSLTKDEPGSWWSVWALHAERRKVHPPPQRRPRFVGPEMQSNAKYTEMKSRVSCFSSPLNSLIGKSSSITLYSQGWSQLKMFRKLTVISVPRNGAWLRIITFVLNHRSIVSDNQITKKIESTFLRYLPSFLRFCAVCVKVCYERSLEYQGIPKYSFSHVISITTYSQETFKTYIQHITL